VKRSLFLCALSLLTGVYCMAFLPAYLPIAGVVFLIFLFLIGSYFTGRSVLLCFMALLFLFGALHMQTVTDVTGKPLYTYLDEYVQIEADCLEEPEDKEGYSVIVAEVKSVSFLNETVSLRDKVRLTVKKGEPIPKFGERFSAICLLSLPDEAMNEGGFDFRKYLQTKNIFFTGHIESGTLAIKGSFNFGLREYVYGINLRCRQMLQDRFPDRAAGILHAVALGDTSGLSAEMKESLRVSGLSHVTTVSGMHITSLMSLLYVLISVFKRNKYRYIWLMGTLLLCFMLFVGAGPSVVRATIMSAMMFLASLCNRKEDGLTSLGVAAAILVLWHPPVALDTGFILSFAATASILIYAKPLEQRLLRLFRLKGKKGWFIRLARGVVSVFAVTVSAQLFILPLSSIFFGTFSVWSFITNILVSPLLMGMLIGGLLVSGLGMIHPLFATFAAGFSYPFVKCFILIAEFFGTKLIGLLTIGTFSILGVLVYGVILILFYIVIKRRNRRVTIALVALVCLTVLGLFGGLALDQRAEVTFINMGQGDSSLIVLPGNTTALIDGGGLPSYMGDYDVGEQILLPYLKKKGIRQLTYVVASHPHEDHIGGLEDILGRISVKNLLIPEGFCETEDGERFVAMAQHHGTEICVLEAGDMVELGGRGQFEVLMPDTDWLKQTKNENDKSLVLRFTYGETAVLFTGDIEKDAEDYLVKHHRTGLDSDILKVAHHGSATSSTAKLLDYVTPRYAFIPCGENNFGHPAQEVLDRLCESDVKVYRADKDKDVTFIMDKKDIIKIKTGGDRHED